MELCVRDHFVQVVDVRRLDVNDAEGGLGVLDVPDVDPQVVRRQEMLAVRRERHRVDVVIVGVGELFPAGGVPVFFDSF